MNSSHHLVDPDLLSFLDTSPTTEFSAAMLPFIRAGVADAYAAQPIPESCNVERLEQVIAGPAGAPKLRVLIYRPKSVRTTLPGLLHLHGGGYVIGTPEVSTIPLHNVAESLGCVIISPDYRLAPEAPHPGPVEDCYAALDFLFRRASLLGIDPNRIGVSGASAGGGLAASLALLARDRGEFKLIFQHLIYPMLDDRTCVATDPHPYTGEFLWNHASNRFGWSSLLGVPAGSAGVSPYAAAARAESLTGLPPAFVATGALDLFLEEDMEYARRLTRAGVPVELHVYPGGFHGFDSVSTADITQRANRDSLAALRRALHPN